MYTLKREGRRPPLLLVNDQLNVLDPTEDGTSGIKRYHVLHTCKTGPCSVLLSHWLCNFLPVPFLPQAILSIFLFLQSDDVRLCLLVLGNLLYMPAAANLNISARICKAEVHLFPSYKVASFRGIPSTSSFLCQVSCSKTCSSFLPTRYI